VLMLAMLLPAMAQEFGQPGSFGDSGQEREFQTVQPTDSEGRRYFIHDLPVKIAIVGGLSLLAAAVLVFRRTRYRKAILVLSVGFVGFYLGGVLCPLSSVQNVFLKADTAYLLLFLMPVVFALVVGRVHCGYVCPFGALQELIHVRKLAVRLPERTRRALSYVKYAVLVYLVTRVLVTHTGILQGLTPFKPLFAWGGTLATVLVTVAFAILSVFLWRPFCETVCPLGALLSLVSRFSLFKLSARDNCVSCGRCTAACRAGACSDGRVASADCLVCGECTQACPVDCLRLVPRWSRR